MEALERALQQDLSFVGTESRLQLVISALEERPIGALNDSEIRLQHLRDEQDRTVAEIEAIETHGRVTAFVPTRHPVEPLSTGPLQND